MNPLVTFQDASLRDDPDVREEAVSALESGRVVYIPDLEFPIESHEKQFFEDDFLQLSSKNVSYDPSTSEIRGIKKSAETTDHDRIALGRMMARYAQFCRDLCATLMGERANRLRIARTSFRPVEIEGRKSRTVGSDDTLLHVDSFSSRPMEGRRILRVFTNVNPVGKPRVWNVGEPFESLASRFLPRLRKPWPGERAALRMLYVTKSYRTLYDHYMLRLHDDMKGDSEYQHSVPFTRVELAAGSTWVCFTDQVSHAALSGQHVLEQTFYLDVEDMVRAERSPLRVLEFLVRRPLV
ncbi:MAG: 3-deoxy-D-manno-oct-2-ulosonic acid (Kdo) hydroxylase [Lysobacterales bacterium]|nr:MAG: 3-deoxy-D-manno-oct-2-ulosonic acid (Kdo) hydroxylase [Xanthomonadales bacterium]